MRGEGEGGRERKREEGRERETERQRDMRAWWGRSEELKTNTVHTTAPWRASDSVWLHVQVGEGTETCKEFPDQNGSTFLLASPSDHMS
jgi:hypothetical protein